MLLNRHMGNYFSPLPFSFFVPFHFRSILCMMYIFVKCIELSVLILPLARVLAEMHSILVLIHEYNPYLLTCIYIIGHLSLY